MNNLSLKQDNCCIRGLYKALIFKMQLFLIDGTKLGFLTKNFGDKNLLMTEAESARKRQDGVTQKEYKTMDVL